MDTFPNVQKLVLFDLSISPLYLGTESQGKVLGPALQTPDCPMGIKYWASALPFQSW